MPKTVYQSKSYSNPRSAGGGRRQGSSSGGYGEFKDRNLAAMSPEAAQEALKPTPAEAVQMQKRMAGCA